MLVSSLTQPNTFAPTADVVFLWWGVLLHVRRARAAARRALVALAGARHPARALSPTGAA